jgi:hypothetical protein
MAIGLTSRSQIMTLPPAGVAGGLTIGAENGVPGPVPGCTAPLGSDAVTGANTKTVNIANANQALTITGTTDPNVKSVTLNVGGSTVPATLAGGTWSATLSPANLPDGALTAAARFTSATGTYHGRTMNLVKDTVAPGAVSASVPSGAYDTARSVALSAEPGATIHYTTDASDPTASSKTFGDAIAVGQAQSIKAVAVDAAGNTGPVAQFDYAINPPATQQGSSKPAPVVVPKLRLDSLDATRSIGLRSVRRHGMQLTIHAPEGTKIVRVRVLRGSRRIDEVTSKMSKDGVLVVNLPHTRKARRALKRGTYQVLVTPGRSSQDLGVTTVRTFKVR